MSERRNENKWNLNNGKTAVFMSGLLRENGVMERVLDHPKTEWFESGDIGKRSNGCKALLLEC